MLRGSAVQIQAPDTQILGLDDQKVAAFKMLLVVRALQRKLLLKKGAFARLRPRYRCQLVAAGAGIKRLQPRDVGWLLGAQRKVYCPRIAVARVTNCIFIAASATRPGDGSAQLNAG